MESKCPACGADGLEVLLELEALRIRRQEERGNRGGDDPPDYIIRVYQAIVASHHGYRSRADWSGKVAAMLKERGTSS